METSVIRFEGSYRALSFGFRLRSLVPGVGPRLDRLLAQFRDPGPDGRGADYLISRRPSDARYLVHRDGRCVHRGSEGSAIDFVLWDVVTRAVTDTGEFLVLHAGAVARGGRGVVLPAPPDSGKTTLTAALTRAGFSYHSDEAALIDPDTGLLHPFPRALWMDASAIDRIDGLWGAVPPRLRRLGRPQYHVRPDDLRPGAVATEARVRYVVAPSYRGGERVDLEPMGRAETLVLLAENAFNLGRFGRVGVEALARVVAGADCYRLRMGNLGTAVAAISGLVADGQEGG